MSDGRNHSSANDESKDPSKIHAASWCSSHFQCESFSLLGRKQVDRSDSFLCSAVLCTAHGSYPNAILSNYKEEADDHQSMCTGTAASGIDIIRNFALDSDKISTTFRHTLE